jgi:hypothetical protein
MTHGTGGHVGIYNDHILVHRHVQRMVQPEEIDVTGCLLNGKDCDR